MDSVKFDLGQKLLVERMSKAPACGLRVNGLDLVMVVMLPMGNGLDFLRVVMWPMASGL